MRLVALLPSGPGPAVCGCSPSWRWAVDEPGQLDGLVVEGHTEFIEHGLCGRFEELLGRPDGLGGVGADRAVDAVERSRIMSGSRRVERLRHPVHRGDNVVPVEGQPAVVVKGEAVACQNPSGGREGVIAKILEQGFVDPEHPLDMMKVRPVHVVLELVPQAAPLAGLVVWFAGRD